MLMANVLFVPFFVFILTGVSFAAEIININYKYKIAFTDMTESEVRPGDLVQVALADGKAVRLKVLETFPVMAKLTIADGDQAITEQQFSSIVVGSAVTLAEHGGRPVRASVKKVVAAPEPAARADVPVSIETYSPGASKDPSLPASSVQHGDVVETAVAPIQHVYAGEAVPSERSRIATLEQRLDQMMANNIKLAENITQLLTEKNAAEAMARAKEADTLAARKRANELADANTELEVKVKALAASVDALGQEKAAQQKEIDALKVRLGELKKKLSKMVDIVNTNMKAYEKQ